jgi:hypothetical protein
MPRRPVHLCQFEACSIQTCLKNNAFKESKCNKEIEAMKECCRKIDYKSFICDGFNPALVRKEGKVDATAEGFTVTKKDSV